MESHVVGYMTVLWINLGPTLSFLKPRIRFKYGLKLPSMGKTHGIAWVTCLGRFGPIPPI